MRFTRDRSALPSEAGFALIEVLISGVIAVVAASGIMALMQSSVHTASDQRSKSISYSLAQEDQTRLRGMAISSLKNFTQKREVAISGTTFTIESSGKFTNSVTGGDLTCASGGSTIDYVTISSKVTWPGMSPTPATEIHSLIAPPNGSLNPGAGTLVFEAMNSTGGALAGIGLSGSGAGSFSGSTNTSGCAIFLEQASGEYTLTTSGYANGVVDADGNVPAAKTIKVSPRVTNTVHLYYDKPGVVPILLKTTGYTSNSINAESNEYLIAYNTGMTTAKKYGEAGKALSPTTFKATSLFPFASNDSFYAGACTTNAPVPAEGSSIVNVKVPVGATYSPNQTLTLPSLLPTIKKKETVTETVKKKTVEEERESTFVGAKVYVTDTECEVSGAPIKREYTTIAGGQIENKKLGLPWSTYEVCTQGTVTTGTTAEKNKVTKLRHEMTTEPVEVHNATTKIEFRIDKESAEGACP